VIIIPAIDILGGECVRLYKGRYDSADKVANDPILTAKSFVSAGTEYIHLVDLDGAKEKRPVNFETFKKIRKAVDVKLELGGGIRSIETVEKYLDLGIDRLILGSSAIADIEFTKKALAKYGDKIAIGIDALNGFVMCDGWLERSSVEFLEFAKKMESLGAANIIFTDISKDGTLGGPNLEALSLLKNNLKTKITASGGIKDIECIKALRRLNLYGAICGKAIYHGSLDLAAAIEISK